MKALAFGTFDGLHRGHEFYLEQASKFGDLYVVVARDETVKKVKNKAPKYDEEKRLEKVSELKYVKKAVLGKSGNKYDIIGEIKPDIICLGYDQTFFVDKLESELKSRGIEAKIVRIKSYKPDKYKSSLLWKK